MELNSVARRIQREVERALAGIQTRASLTQGEVFARFSAPEEEFVSAAVTFVCDLEPSAVQFATGFCSHNSSAGVVEHSLLAVTLTQGRRSLAFTDEAPQIEALKSALEAVGGALTLKMSDVRRLRLMFLLPFCERDELDDCSSGVEKTVLLVEDEESLREITADVLRTAGYRILTAEDASSAIAAFEENLGEIDLLMTDLEMPGMNGRELAEHLFERRPGLRTLFSTGYSEQSVLRNGVDDISSFYLQKPYSLQALRQKVREVFGHEIGVHHPGVMTAADVIGKLPTADSSGGWLYGTER